MLTHVKFPTFAMENPRYGGLIRLRLFVDTPETVLRSGVGPCKTD